MTDRTLMMERLVLAVRDLLADPAMVNVSGLLRFLADRCEGERPMSSTLEDRAQWAYEDWGKQVGDARPWDALPSMVRAAWCVIAADRRTT